MITQPDIVVMNARIWTGEAGLPYAEALAIQGDRIIAIGSNEAIRLIQGQATKVLDAAGHLVLPGFIDNHTHLLLGGFRLLSLDLRRVKSKVEFIAAIASRSTDIPRGGWLCGGGWNNDQWEAACIPVKEWIDDLTPHTPVFVTRSDLHMGFANNAALNFAGINRNTANPQGGLIEKDGYTGEPTGILKDNAMKLVERCIPKPSEEDYDKALSTAMQHAARLGITSVQDITAWGDWNDWQTLRRFQGKKQLTLRIYARTQITEWEKQLDQLKAGFCGDSWLRFGGVKGFVDGSLGSGTALMFEPYDDVPQSAGLLIDQMYPEGMMHARIAAADKAGLPVSIHAIGDKANHLLLDIFAAVIKENGARDRRFRTEHAQHLQPGDILRMAQLGILASVQPSHVYEDGCWAERRIGKRRSPMTYAFRSLLAAAVPVSFGTDWPVAPLDPFLGMYAAVTRQTRDGQHPDGWVPEQKLAVGECLRAYTSGSAYAEFSENVKGTLKPGKLADLILVSEDILAAQPEAIKRTRVLWEPWLAANLFIRNNHRGKA